MCSIFALVKLVVAQSIRNFLAFCEARPIIAKFTEYYPEPAECRQHPSFLLI
jgi:hypothetical protein